MSIEVILILLVGTEKQTVYLKFIDNSKCVTRVLKIWWNSNIKKRAKNRKIQMQFNLSLAKIKLKLKNQIQFENENICTKSGS